MATADRIADGRAGGPGGAGLAGALPAFMQAPGARGLLALAFPLVLSRAGLAAMAITTAALVARFDAGQVATFALAEGTLGRIIDIGIAFVASAIVLFAPSQDPVADRGKRLALWLRTSACAGGFGVIALLAAFTASLWLPLLGQPAEIAQQMRGVLLLLGFSAPAGLIAIASAIYLEATGRARAVAVSVISANVVNVAAGAILITGAMGMPALGATGAAATSLVVRLLLAIVLVGLVLKTGDFKASASRRLDADTSRKHWQLGLSASTTVGALHLMGITMTGLAGWIGTLEVAAYASCWILILPVMLVAGGTAEAIAVRVAASRERGTLDAVMRGDFLMLGLVIVPIAFVLDWGAGAIGGLYSNDPALATLIGQLLPLAALILVLDAFAVACISALRGLGDAIAPMTVQLLVVVLTPALAYVFAFAAIATFPQGLFGLVCAIAITSTLRLSLVALRLAQMRHLHRFAEA